MQAMVDGYFRRLINLFGGGQHYYTPRLNGSKEVAIKTDLHYYQAAITAPAWRLLAARSRSMCRSEVLSGHLSLSGCRESAYPIIRNRIDGLRAPIWAWLVHRGSIQLASPDVHPARMVRQRHENVPTRMISVRGGHVTTLASVQC
jgi:hypothetical protein